MPDDLKLGDIVESLMDGKRPATQFMGRVKTMQKADILPVAHRTEGGQARYGTEALVAAAIYNELFNLGMHHPKTEDPEGSPFLAVASTLDGETLDWIEMHSRAGQNWVVRLDLIEGTRFKARTYYFEDENVGTPPGTTSSVFIDVRPIVQRILGAN